MGALLRAAWCTSSAASIPKRAADNPRLLLVAPMSGHFATLLRGTVETFLPDHDVYITDWQDARDMPLSAGRFDLDDYIDMMADMFRFFGGDVHVFAVCQPSVPVLAAAALMEADGDPCVPLSLILAGGPIDTRINPTVVNKLAEERGTDWFRRNVITNVPWPSPGRGRQVYPGFLQLSGFMTMNLDRHMQAHKDMFQHLVRGDGDSAEKHREFYDEYLAVMDLTAEFYLQTVDTVFVQHLMPRGLMTHRGRTVDLAAIKPPGADDGRGREGRHHRHRPMPRRTRSVRRMLQRTTRSHFECPKVGHYGVFNGARFRSEIAPRMAKFMRAHDPCASTNLSIAQLEHMATMPQTRPQAAAGAGSRRACLQFSTLCLKSESNCKSVARTPHGCLVYCARVDSADCNTKNLLGQKSGLDAMRRHAR